MQQTSLKVNFGNMMDVTERNPMINRLVTQKIEYLDSNLISNRTQDEENKQNNNNSLIDGQSSKCFIELLNGQPVRNIRNIFKNTNRVEMEFYRVSNLILHLINLGLSWLLLVFISNDFQDRPCCGWYSPFDGVVYDLF